jgi:hypothetical protein
MSIESQAEASVDSHGSCHASRHASPARKAHSTSKRSEAVDLVTLPLRPGSSDAMSCCPLTSGLIVVASRAHSNNDSALALSQSDVTSHALANLHSAPLAIPLRLPTQTHLYLRGCAFLI